MEEADFPDYDSLYCRLFWVAGQDWTVTAGQEEGVSQVSNKSLDASGLLNIITFH